MDSSHSFDERENLPDEDDSFATSYPDLKESLKDGFKDLIPSFKDVSNREYFHEFIQQYTLLTKAINQIHSAIFIFRYKSKKDVDLIWVNNRYKNWLKEYLADHDIDETTSTFNSFLVKDDIEQFKKGYEFFLEHPAEPFRTIHHRQDKDGRDLWLFINAIVIEYNKKKKPDLVVMMITDLTNEIDSEISLKNLLDQNLEVRKQYQAVELTDRQREILKLIIKGYTNKEIAEELNISQHTVDTHRKKLLAKFKAKNSATLVRVAFEMGLQ